MLNSVRKSSNFEPSERHYFSPEDVAIMRRAFHIACQERPLAAWTDAQRLILAKAIVVVYNPILSEGALIDAAFDLTS